MILSRNNQKRIDSGLDSSHHALLLSGRAGVGFEAARVYILERLNIHSSQIHSIAPEQGKDISIDEIRKLYEYTRSTRDNLFVVYISHAHQMSHAAQHALLKLLEEPVDNVRFILTTEHKALLLPTILSRVVSIELRPLTKNESVGYLDSKGVSGQKQHQMLFMAGGLADHLSDLSDNEATYNEHREMVIAAKRFLTSDTYTRLAMIKEFHDRQQSAQLIHSLAQLVLHTIREEVTPMQSRSTALISSALDAVESHANHKLTLTQLAIKL